MENQYNLSKCSATGKTRFPTPGDAKKAILHLKHKNKLYDNVSSKRYKHRRGKAVQCRFYVCKFCKGYHLTSQEAVLTQNRIERIYKQRVRTTEGLVKTPEEAEQWKADGLPFPETKNQEE